MDDVQVRADVSFEELFRDQYPRLVAFGLSMTGSVEVSRDLAQETMARAHQRWAVVVESDVPEAWLRRVMKNLVVDHLRRRQVETGALERLSSRPESKPGVGGDSRLAELLAVLPERQRLVAALVYGSDLSIDDVAAALGIAPGTVKATLWQARRSIRRRLEQEADRD
jgi:RNA polymerase sigma factor (sigma-70 family)